MLQPLQQWTEICTIGIECHGPDVCFESRLIEFHSETKPGIIMVTLDTLGQIISERSNGWLVYRTVLTMPMINLFC